MNILRILFIIIIIGGCITGSVFLGLYIKKEYDTNGSNKSPEGLVCLGNTSDRDYQTKCMKKDRFSDKYLGLQGKCDEGDTMIAYNASNCTQGNRRGYCKRGKPESTWEFKRGGDCKEPSVGNKTDCKVTLYQDTNFKGDYMEFDRSVKSFSSPYDFGDKASSLKYEGDCKTIKLYKDSNFSGAVYDVIESPESNSQLSKSDFNDTASSIEIK